MISIKDVSMEYPLPKRYVDYLSKPFRIDYFKALKDVSLDIKPGDRVAFLGVNGAGKTTLLKIIGGLLYPSYGAVTINGYDTSKENLKARRRVGFVLNEERSFYWRLTGMQNLNFFGSLDNLKGDELEKKVEWLLKIVGLYESKDRLFAGYSSGMKQKLALARGLISDPDILILDEPTRTLDPISAGDISAIISGKIHEKKERTLLIATHSLSEAEALCDKVCFMKKGNVIDFSTMQAINKEYDCLDDYYRSMMNIEGHK